MASFNKKELDKFKGVLMVFRNKITGDLKHLEKDSLNTNARESAGDLSGYSFHMADMATDNFDREFTLGLASNEQQMLNLVDDALHRIEDGSFGTCEACKKAIPVKRLQAQPYARLCIKCQEEEEKKRRRGD